VNVGMQQQVLSPGVQDRDHADLGAYSAKGGPRTSLGFPSIFRPWMSSPNASRLHGEALRLLYKCG
jgi:hypothetical protein